MSDSFLVLYDFDILSMIKRKNPFGFYCLILILNLSRLIPLITIPKFVAFDFSNAFLISKIWRVWFPNFVAFDFSNDTFDFQNLSRLISQITLLISEICRVWFLKYHFRFPKWDRYGWYSCDSSVGGKPYSRQGQGDTQSIVTSRSNEAERVF